MVITPGDILLLMFLGIIALGLTVCMFSSRQMVLGFPSAMFWMILGATAYLMSDDPWVDVFFYIFFACSFGMTIFCALAAYGLRERKDIESDEGELIDEQPDETYLDERPGEFFDEQGYRSGSNRGKKRNPTPREWAESKREKSEARRARKDAEWGKI